LLHELSIPAEATESLRIRLEIRPQVAVPSELPLTLRVHCS